ncbi:MAG: DinB family protein [Maribacter sp.]
MKKLDLISSLELSYTTFINFINLLSDEDCNYLKDGKWSAGQHLDHLVLSTKAIVSVFKLDKVSIAEKFGHTTNSSRSYANLKALYFEKLEGGGKAPDRFVPDVKVIHQKSISCQNLNMHIDQLSSAIDNFSEDELDTLCIPHPLLGNLSLREMLYNAIYHAEHHQNLIAKMLKS